MRFTEGNEYRIVFENTLQLFGYQNKTNSASLVCGTQHVILTALPTKYASTFNVKNLTYKHKRHSLEIWYAKLRYDF